MINNYTELKSLLDKHFGNLFTLSTHSTDSNKVNIDYLTSTLTINLPISENELGNELSLLVLNNMQKLYNIQKELSNEKNQRF